ncbi:contractile injection system tape measure protein [Xenorhabdus bovienii]|uniref:contractile injection system tape measure protein n=1 Tax=Xenorhabdus bovienii TaxID=40576 RepID=UPI00237CD0DA|nr:contractile injection system tape measure protein [Xenorhabdus bovienii]MDE1474199.1 hypothetical protein [Xenorhabdus bovienii]
MTSEKNGVNFIDKITISIDMLYFKNNRMMDDVSFLFNNKLKHIINENVTNLALSINGNLYLEKVILDLGNIEINFFEREATRKFETELKKHFKKYHGYSKYISNTEEVFLQKSVNNISPNAFERSSLIKKVDHYLHKGNWLSNDSNHHAPNIVRIDNKLWQQINYQPQKWLPMLAKHCLQPAGLSRLIQICQPDVLSMLCQLFTETTTYEFINFQAQATIDTNVIPEKLSLAAEYYLLNRMIYVNAIQQPFALQTESELTSERDIVGNSCNPLKQDNRETNTRTETAQPTQNKLTQTVNITQTDSSLLKQIHNKNDMRMDAVPPFTLFSMQTHHQPTATKSHYGLIKEAVKQNPPTLQNKDQHREWLKSASLTQIPSIQPSNGIQTSSAQPTFPISNAGCMILWPLLTTFFSTFGLLDKNQFISLEAQREAVCLLDWLIWAEDEIPAWRLTLNKVICGLPVDGNALWRAPAPEQQTLISHWLENTIVQLPAWKKMGVSDVRHLFLQRSGELSELNGVTNIHIKPEVYDALIGEWPWPINMASFSWLKQPLTMTWL